MSRWICAARGAQEGPPASGGPGKEDEISGSGQRWEAYIYSTPEDIFVGTILGKAPKLSIGKGEKKNLLVGPPTLPPSPHLQANVTIRLVEGGGKKKMGKKAGMLLLLPVKSRTISGLGRLPKGLTSLSPLQRLSSLIGSCHGHNVTHLHCACSVWDRVFRAWKHNDSFYSRIPRLWGTLGLCNVEFMTSSYNSARMLYNFVNRNLSLWKETIVHLHDNAME